MLGWFGGGIALSDPIFSDWIVQQAPALTVVVPLLAAIYVLAQVAIMRESEPRAAALRPEPRVKIRVDPAVNKKPWFVSNKHTVPTDYALSAVDTSPAIPKSDTQTAPLQTSRIVQVLRYFHWPDSAEWPIYERWGTGSLGATGFLLFALRPLPALATVLGIVAVLGMTLAPHVQGTMLRKGWRSAVAVAAVCIGLAAIAAVMLLLFAATGWLGPIFR